MTRSMFLPAAALCLLLTSCSEAPPGAEKKEPEKALEPVTGQSGLYKMYQVVRSWAPDAKVLKMNSMPLSEVPNVPPGKAAAWQATFISEAKSQSRTYTYSIVEDLPNNLHKGVFASMEEGWNGSQDANNQPFLIAAVKADTDAAYKAALAQAVDYDKKNPGKPITLLLEKNPQFPDPVWRVVWGESVGTSNFSIYVDATTGLFLEKMR
ncbi:MAG: hypothetical protein ACLQU1_07825 [Bryobacteraceae bacterium]